MKKVYQTIVDKDHGNCMQAAIASLLELELEEVPDFNEFSKNGNTDFKNTLHGFIISYNYDACTINRRHNRDTEFLKKVARFDGGVNGYFYASVPSQTYPDRTHAVIVDMDLNIVHDPNPNGKALNLSPDDVIDILVMHEMIIGKTGKLFTMDDWDNATKEEQDLNTYKQND